MRGDKLGSYHIIQLLYSFSLHDIYCLCPCNVCSTSATVVISNPAYETVPQNTDTAGGLSDTSPEYAEVYTEEKEPSMQEATSKKDTDHEVC